MLPSQQRSNWLITSAKRVSNNDFNDLLIPDTKLFIRLGLHTEHRLVINLLLIQDTPGGCHGAVRALVLGVTVQDDFDKTGKKKESFFLFFVFFSDPKELVQPVVHQVINDEHIL